MKSNPDVRTAMNLLLCDIASEKMEQSKNVFNLDPGPQACLYGNSINTNQNANNFFAGVLYFFNCFYGFIVSLIFYFLVGNVFSRRNFY